MFLKSLQHDNKSEYVRQSKAGSTQLKSNYK